jgi:hypothetical protein
MDWGSWAVSVVHRPHHYSLTKTVFSRQCSQATHRSRSSFSSVDAHNCKRLAYRNSRSLNTLWQHASFGERRGTVGGTFDGFGLITLDPPNLLAFTRLAQELPACWYPAPLAMAVLQFWNHDALLFAHASRWS